MGPGSGDWLSEDYESNWVRDKGCATGIADSMVGSRRTRRESVIATLMIGVVLLAMAAAGALTGEGTAALWATLVSAGYFAAAWFMHRFAST